MVDDRFAPRSPFENIPAVPATGSGVTVLDRDGLGLATVLARKSQTAALRLCVRAVLGVELPRGPRYVATESVAFAGTGREAWLAICQSGSNGFASSLSDTLQGLASVSDQSDGYAVLRLTGPRLRDTLSKILPIDLHPRALKAGDVATTVASHMGATLWRLDDAYCGSPVFEIAVFRSLAASFWHALSTAAAEFGLSAADPSRHT
jgi:methylglutamate dehydrogenase subunit D